MQTAFYDDDRWPAAGSRLDNSAMERILQDLIDRGALSAPTNDGCPLHVAIVIGGPIAYEGAQGLLSFEHPRGGRLTYEVIAASGSRGEANQIRARIQRGLRRQSRLPPQGSTGRDWGSLLPLPPLTIEARRPLFRIAQADLDAYIERVRSETPLVDAPGADTILRRLLRETERRRAERADDRGAPTPAELRDFSRPNPRLAMADRFEAMAHVLGRDHPDIALVRRILDGIEEPDLARLRGRYLKEFASQGAFKFADLVFWTHHKLKLARVLGLEGAPPLSVWDIGCGGGHFVRICRRLGHEALGTDQDHPIYRDIAALTAGGRVVDSIAPLTPTSDFCRRFDLVTATAIEFNRLGPSLDGEPQFWRVDHWRFLLNDLIERQLRFPGRIYLGLNCEIREGHVAHNVELLNLCEAHGAEVNHRAGIIDWRLTAPVRL